MRTNLRRLASLWPGLLLLCCLPAKGAMPDGESVRVGGTGAGTLLLQRLGEAYGKGTSGARVHAVLPPLGSAGGVRALAASAVDLAVVVFPPGRDAPAVGRSQPWVRTPLVFVAGGAPGEQELTRDQVADVYAGRLRQWPDGRPIRPVLRYPQESELKLLRAISPEMNAAVGLAHKRGGTPLAENDLDNLQLLERTPGSFGALSLGQLLLAGSPLAPLKIDGVPPTVAALRSRRYPYEKTLHLVVGRDPSPATQRFVAYLHSPAARDLLVGLGYLTIAGGAP